MSPPFSTDDLLQQTHWLHRLARGLTGDAARADDLVQDTMVMALRRAPRGLRDLRAWLATLLRRRAQRLRHREAMRPVVERAAARAEATPSADEVVAAALVQRDVVDAVLALSEPYRTAILLRYLSDLPVAEVAARTGVPVATARSHLQRGLERLRTRLDHRYGSRAAWSAPLGALPTLGPVAVALPLMNAKPLASLFAAGLALATALWWFVPDASVPSPPSVAATAPRGADNAVASRIETTGSAPRELAAASAAAPGEPAHTVAVVVGTAVDEETRLPLENVLVSWQDDGGANPPPNATARTDAAGRFELSSDVVDPQHGAKVLLRREGYAWVTRQPGDPEGSAPQRMDLGTVPLPPGTGLAGVVVDRAGAPVADATVLFYDTLFYVDGGRAIDLSSPLVLGTTGADGSFAPNARVAPEQDAMLVAAGPRGLGWLPVGGVTRSRAQLDGLRIVLADGCDLAVQVRDRAGAPVAGVMVFANPGFEPLGTAQGWQRPLGRVPGIADVFVATTDANGDARLPALPRGRDGGHYVLRTERPGLLATELPLDLAGAAAQVRLTVAPPRTIEFSGTVTDTDGHALAGAAVTITGRAPQATTRADGTFATSLRVADALLFASASAGGHQPQQVQAKVDPESDRLELSFRLQPAADLAGVVVDEAEQPVAGAQLIAVGARATAMTDQQGRFRLANLPRGRSVDLAVEPPGDEAGWEPTPYFTVSTAASPVTLRLRRRAGTCALVVDLLAADDSPLEAKRQQLSTGDGRWHESTATIGRIEAEHLAAGPWQLRVEPLRGPLLVARFTIADGEPEHRLTLRQAPSSSVQVEIVPATVGGALPAELRIGTGADNTGTFVPADGQRLDGGVLVLATARGLSFRVDDVDAGRPLQLWVEGDDCCGDASINLRTDQVVQARLSVVTPGTIRFVADAPWPQHGLTLYLHRPGTPLGAPERWEEIEGRTDVARVRRAAGAWEWRVETLPDGAPRPTAWEGRVEVTSGAEVTARLAAPTAR